MQRTRLATLALVALVALVATVGTIACDSKPEPAKTEPAKTEPEPAKPETAKPEPTAPKFTPAAANTPGPAFFTVDKVGVVKLDEAGFAIVEGSPSTLQKDLQVGPDGALYMLGHEDIYRLEGERMVSIARGGQDDLGGSPDHLAVAPSGELWVTSFKGVARWDGKSWTTEERARIGAGDDPLAAIAVDKDNRVWVASTTLLHVREAEAWRTVDLGQARRGKSYLKDLERDPAGAVHLVMDNTVLKVGPTPADIVKVNVGVKGSAQLSDIRFALGGSIGLISDQDVYHVPAGGSPRKYSSEKSRDFTADHISTIAPDDSGRLWVGSDIGVIVIVPGGPRVEWLSGSVPELIGTVGDMIVFGAGPTTLPAAGPRGSVSPEAK